MRLAGASIRSDLDLAAWERDHGGVLGVKTPSMIGLSDLLESLYGGINCSHPWELFLSAFAQWMDATYATLIIAAPGTELPGTFVTPNADPERSARYISSFFADDPFQGLPEGKVIAFADFIRDQPSDRYSAYREYLALAGGEQVLAVDLRFSGRFEARFRVMRDAARPDFNRADRLAMQSLVPHLRIAVRLFERLQFANAEQGVFHSATQGLGIALLVLDRDGHLVSSNPLGERFLAESEGVRKVGSTIRFEASAQRDLVASLRSKQSHVGRVTRFRIARPEHGDLLASARPIDLPAIHSGTGALALFLTLPGEEPLLEAETVRDIFGLTAAEARLAVLLAQGLSLVEAAGRVGIAHNTAKVHMRSIFAKTGVRRQSQVVGMLKALAG